MEGSADYENLKDWAEKQIEKRDLVIALETARGDKATLLCLDMRDLLGKLWIDRLRARGLSDPYDDLDKQIVDLLNRAERLGD